MLNQKDYDKELELLKVEADKINSPTKIAEYQILSLPEIKKAIIDTSNNNQVSYSKFRLRKLSIDLATIELLFTKSASLLKASSESVVCEIEIDEDLFQLLELAYLNGTNVGDSSALPFVLNIPSNASNVITPEEEMQELLATEDEYLESLGLSNLKKCSVTTLDPTYRQTTRRTANYTRSQCGNPPRADESRADGSRSDYSQDSMGMDSRCDN